MFRTYYNHQEKAREAALEAARMPEAVRNTVNHAGQGGGGGGMDDDSMWDRGGDGGGPAEGEEERPPLDDQNQNPEVCSLVLFSVSFTKPSL